MLLILSVSVSVSRLKTRPDSRIPEPLLAVSSEQCIDLNLCLCQAARVMHTYIYCLPMAHGHTQLLSPTSAHIILHYCIHMNVLIVYDTHRLFL